MGKRVTQESIAKQLHLSRNTVSKVFNNRPGITGKTRDKVIAKARELNYRPGSAGAAALEARPENRRKRDIAFICHSDSFTGSFWPPIIQNVELTLSRNDTNLRLVIVRPDEELQCALPDSLTLPPPAGIIMAGLFRSEYYKKVVGLGFPTVTLDISTDLAAGKKICDVVLMDNFYAVYVITRHIIESGHRNIVFAGDKASCLSFYQRWEGYRRAMADCGLPVPAEAQFDFPSESRHYLTEEFYEKLKDIKDLPTAFVCANDRIAKAVDMLRHPPYSLYGDKLAISGFDRTGEYAVSLPNFWTVEIYPGEIGNVLAEDILWRACHPGRKFRSIQIESTPVCQNS